MYLVAGSSGCQGGAQQVLDRTVFSLKQQLLISEGAQCGSSFVTNGPSSRTRTGLEREGDFQQLPWCQLQLILERDSLVNYPHSGNVQIYITVMCYAQGCLSKLQAVQNGRISHQCWNSSQSLPVLLGALGLSLALKSLDHDLTYIWGWIKRSSKNTLL